MSGLISINDRISYLPSSDKPLSADVVFVKGQDCTWIYDVGTSSEACELINEIEGRKNIVLSHFHPDHIGNLIRVKFDELFVSKNTKKYVMCGNVVDEKFNVDGISVFPVPSSHSKGCLALSVDEYCFLGDATYAHIGTGKRTYNTQLLKTEIELLESLEAKYFGLSHGRRFIQTKEIVLSLLNGIYESRDPSKSEIEVDVLFKM